MSNLHAECVEQLSLHGLCSLRHQIAARDVMVDRERGEKHEPEANRHKAQSAQISSNRCPVERTIALKVVAYITDYQITAD